MPSRLPLSNPFSGPHVPGPVETGPLARPLAPAFKGRTELDFRGRGEVDIRKGMWDVKVETAAAPSSRTRDYLMKIGRLRTNASAKPDPRPRGKAPMRSTAMPASATADDAAQDDDWLGDLAPSPVEGDLPRPSERPQAMSPFDAPSPGPAAEALDLDTNPFT